MTETSFPWAGTSTGDAGPYSDTEFANFVKGLVFDGANINYGIIRAFQNESEVAPTSPATAQIQVATGGAVIQGRYYISTAVENFTIVANSSGNPRIDAVVLRVDYVAQTIRLAIKQGTPAVSPALPGLTQTPNVLWEIYVARVAVASGFGTIVAANITDMRTWCNVPDAIGEDISNSSGNIREKGDVVVRSVATPGYPVSIATTTTKRNHMAYGIMESRTAAGGAGGRVIVQGVTPVLCMEAVAVGDTLITSTTAGSAAKADVYDQGAWGVVLTANTGAGTLCLAYVNFRAVQLPVNPAFFAYANANQAFAGAQTTKITLQAEDYDYASAFDAVTNYRYTAITAGLYHFTGGIGNATSGQSITPFLYKNNNSTIRGTAAQTATATQTSTVTADIELAVGDYIELIGTSSAALTVAGAAAAPRTTYLCGYLICKYPTA